MAAFPILTTLVLVAFIATWTFKRAGRHSRGRGKPPVRDESVDGEGGRAASPAGRSSGVLPSEPERGALEAKIRVLESQLEERALQLEEKELQLEERNRENLELKKQALKYKNKTKGLKENIKKYKATNKEVRQASGKKRKEASATGGKRTGKPPGSNGGGFTRPNVEPDEKKHHHLQYCPKCGKSLAGVGPLDSWSHWIIDIVRPDEKHGKGLVFWITDHVIYRYTCPHCKQRVHRDFGTLKHAHYGVGLIAFVMAERIENRMPWKNITNTLYRLAWDVKLIPTIKTFMDWMGRYEPEARQMYEAIRASIKESLFAHVDETGIPKDGKNWWMWVVVTGHVVLFLQDASRGHQVIKDIFDDYKGILLSDFWTAYNCLDVEQQKCLAHLVKDLKNMAHDAAKKGDKARDRLDEGARAREVAGKQPGRGKRGRPGKPPEPLTAKQRTRLEKEVQECDKLFIQVERLREFFKLAWGEGDMGYKAPVDGRITKDEAIARMQAIIDGIRDEGPANADVERIIKRMEKFAPCLFTYLDHPEIPPDNNPAERALRHFVVQRKVSGNFISDEALETYAMHLSFYETCVKQGVNYNDLLGMLLNGETAKVIRLLGLPSGEPPPGETGVHA